MGAFAKNLINQSGSTIHGKPYEKTYGGPYCIQCDGKPTEECKLNNHM